MPLCFDAFPAPPTLSGRIHWPLFPRHSQLATIPTHHPASGVRPMQTLPHWLQPVTCWRIKKERTGPIPTGGSAILVCAMPSDSCGKNHPFSATCRRPTVDHSLVAGGDQRHPLEACLADGHRPECPMFHVIDPLGPPAYREAKGAGGLAFGFLVPECDMSIRTTNGQSVSHFL